MDVRELFTKKPLLSLKRATEDENDERKQLKKMRRMVPAELNQMTDPSSMDEENSMDKESEHESLDEVNVKRIILNFEKGILKNREMRIKFSDSPEKFMKSEIQLHETLQEMGILVYIIYLFTLQLIDYMIVAICGSSTTTKQRVIQILNLRSASLDTIKDIMREYAKNLGDAGDKKWRDNEKRHILQLVEKL